MEFSRHVLIHALQRATSRLNPSYVETLSQTSYLELGRRTEWLREPPLASAMGGTASFSLLYLLLSILREGRPSSILELGAGMSTTLIGDYVQATDARSVHVDDDQEWLSRSVPDSDAATAIHAPLTAKVEEGRNIRWYGCEPPGGPFDLVLVDGPQAWSGEDRYNRLGVLAWLPELLDREFVVVVDDASRPGERVLADALERRLTAAGHEIGRASFPGRTTQTLLASPAYARFRYL